MLRHRCNVIKTSVEWNQNQAFTKNIFSLHEDSYLSSSKIRGIEDKMNKDAEALVENKKEKKSSWNCFKPWFSLVSINIYFIKKGLESENTYFFFSIRLKVLQKREVKFEGLKKFFYLQLWPLAIYGPLRYKDA